MKQHVVAVAVAGESHCEIDGLYAMQVSPFWMVS